MRSAGNDRLQLKRAAAELEELIRRDALYVEAHPELYYFLARAQDAAASFDKAVRNMKAYVARELAPPSADAAAAAPGAAANDTAHRE
jgi:hypothetical protein